MVQLVQLQKEAKTFEELNTEVIVIFREEKSGVEGLKKIRSRTKTSFTLGLDFNRESTAAYSPGKQSFDNFVIDRSGVIRHVLDGTKIRRATSDQLLQAVRELPKTDP